MKTTRFQHLPPRGLWARVALCLALLVGALAAVPLGPAYADNPAPVQVFYVTLPEGDALSFFKAVNTAGGNIPPSARPVTTFFSIAIGVDGTYVYYDQWENGYAADVANPTPAEIYSAGSNPGGVQIWGNGESDDGCAPNIDGVPFTCTDGADVLNAGDVIVPNNDVDVSQSDALDRFSTVAYNNNDGTNNWAGSWDETGDNDLPGSIDILITSSQLRFAATADAGDSIERAVSLPSGDTCATLSFDLGNGPGITLGGNNENIRVDIDDDAGASWTTLWTFDNDSANNPAHTWGFDLPTGEVGPNTRIRFYLEDDLSTDDYWSFDNVKVMWGCGSNPAKVVFDAKDKVGASKSVAMSRAAWAAGADTLLAFAHEIHPTAEWGTAYESPVGANTPNDGAMFEYNALSIMASQTGTTVEIDADGVGGYETTTTLNEGGSYFVTGISRGARVQTTDANKSIQVLLLTGDIEATYESRDMTLLPTSRYGTSYWAPVGIGQGDDWWDGTNPPGSAYTVGPVRLFVYNPSTNGNIYITCEVRGAPTSTQGPVAARGVVTVDLDRYDGGRCYASNIGGTATGEPIFAVGTFDTDVGTETASRADWSFTLYPDSFLSTDALVGLGVGRDPTSSVYLSQNSSPLWVTSACTTGSTYVYVDWDNDGTANLVDINGDGDTGDANVDGVNETTSNNGMSIARLQSVKFFEPPLDDEPFDQTAARVWSCSTLNTPVRANCTSPGCSIALAWGQDSYTAYQALPALDAGTTVPPLRLQEGSKSLEVVNDTAPTGVLNPGDTVRYNITIRNTGSTVINNVYVYDTVPANTTYVAGTTQKDVGAGWVAIPDDGSGTAFPLDATPNGVLLGNLGAGATFYVRFSLTLNTGADYEQISNCDTVTSSAGSFKSCVTTPVATRDWGDLPDSYGTSAAANGPRHSSSSLKLGTGWDIEAQGAPSGAANGDDTATTDDEDGVANAASPEQWDQGNGAFSVTVTGGPGCLNAWMDFTNDAGSGAGVTYYDGNFTKAAGGYDTYSTYSEHIVQNVKLATGTANVSVSVPPGMYSGGLTSFYLRFRLSPTDGGGNCTTAVAPVGFVAGGEVEDYVFSPQNSAIGNYLWLDENSDGYQDAGEPGLPNVRVWLKNSTGTVIATTWTDAAGGYLFRGLMAGTYYVDVDETTLPAGMTQTPYNLPGADLGNQDQSTGFGYQVVLPAGGENLTADFGYNWNPSGDVNGNTGTATIGDRVWIDADGDGLQDVEEIGIAGVTVQLFTPGPDGLFGTADDVAGPTDTTDANGNYIFDGLTPGAYVVKVMTPPAGYTQTGDPDHFGLQAGVNDNQTTTPVVLGPGDVFLNADFGYQPPASQNNSIGDKVWFDADADGIGPPGAPGGGDTNEYGIPGVTVELIQDTNNDGIWDPDGPDNIPGNADDEPIVGSDTTDASGNYLFSGLPDGSYLVRVNDTDNVLSRMRPTYDATAPVTDSTSWVQNLGVGNPNPVSNTLQDFGFTAASQTSTTGLIGDRVWLDIDGAGDQDANEPGLEGLLVTLKDGSGNTLATTTTDENGNYYFGGLPAGTYTVVVTPPGGMTQTYDADGTGSAHQSTVTIGAGGINLLQDFGYRGTGTVGNLVWEDLNADGNVDSGENGIGGVTLDLYWDLNGNGKIDAGEPLVGSTTTAPDGSYLFSGLPTDDGGGNAQFVVDVTDDAGKLGGWWHSLGTPGVNDHSQTDPYPVTLTPGAPNNLTADFGYYVKPAGLGNYVWNDLDYDGIQDAGEPGIPGVIVTLTIAWPDGLTTSTLYAMTDASGHYSFGNLLLDEDYNGDGVAPEPAHTISINTNQAALAGLLVTQVGAPGSTQFNDSNNPAGTPAQPVQGRTDTTVDTDPIASYDFGFVKPATIGNYLWLDENSDGYQDAGEPGLPNVQVNLYDAAGALVATTYTDSSGGYLFDSLRPGTYYVDVLDGTGNQGYSLPVPGMTQTPYNLQGADLGNQNHSATPIPNTGFTGYPVTVTSGSENLTADFGYNYNPTTDVDNGTGTATLGDRVWVDADGDGFQDTNEVGLANVPVTLYYDPDGNGVYDTPYPGGTATTDADGYYIFDGLPAGAYVVVVTPPGGYTQTGDPDHFGTTGTVNDNQTTTPVILGPGDVFLNADFGYQPPASQNNSIGDKVWFDADSDGIGPAGAPGGGDTNEYGIAGVTVALIKDLNGNGTWDAGEPIIATDTTDANGDYLFPGLPDGNYLVWVNDTDNVLGAMRPTYDSNGGTPPTGSGAPTGLASSTVLGLSAAALDPGGTNNSPVNDLAQDFGYTAVGQTSTTGLIGDRVWLDINGDTVQDANEPGLEGLLVTLKDGSGNTLATTTTDENGNYYFGGLPAGTYTVVVIPPSGMTQTYDADGTGTPHQSTVTIAAGGINLLQDFGYRGTGSIGNLVWEDLNADGDVDVGENGIGGVTLDLYWDLNGNGRADAGEPLVGSTTTAPDGSYLFSGLPTDDGGGNAQFVVDVTDENGKLGGWWHSLGTPGSDNNSQTDPYPVTLTPGAPSNTTADFGYYVKPAAVGNYVWNDLDYDGIQDAGEVGIPGVIVTLTIAWPGGGSSTVNVVTDATGHYSFGNLLLDEDYNGDVIAPEPTHTISINTGQPALSGAVPSPIGAPGSTPFDDSDNPAGTPAYPVQGSTDTTNDASTIASYDYGFYYYPTGVKLSYFRATIRPDGVLLEWETTEEIDNLGFNLYRARRPDGQMRPINEQLIPSLVPPGSPFGAQYAWTDTTARRGAVYYYWLEAVDIYGQTTLYGPVKAEQTSPGINPGTGTP